MDKDKTILIVDDTAENIAVVNGLLVDTYKTKIARNGEKAVKIAGQKPHPDLILLDVVMPEMDGYQVMEHLKQNPDTADIPVIFLTARSRVEDEEKGFALGAVDYITKPISPPIMMARIKTHLALKQANEILQQQKDVLEHDLEIGRKIQHSFFPDRLPDLEGWEIAPHFVSARQVAGDFYDVFEIPNSDCLGLVVADVCDKGVGAALFMGLFRSLIRAITGLYFNRAWVPHIDDAVAGSGNGASCSALAKNADAIRVAMEFTNNYIARTHDNASMFCTMFYAILDPRSGHLCYVNAGHEAPFVLNQNGIRQQMPPTGPALGMMPDLPFDVGRADLEWGDTLVGYTDGVTEAKSPEGWLFGEERLKALLNMPTQSARDLLEQVAGALEAFTRGAPQSDDITLLAVQRK